MNIRSILFLYIFLSLLAACSTSPEQKSSVVLTDDVGRELHLPALPRTTMALSASTTEMLFSVLDDPSRIIARTPHDNYPADIDHLPVIQNFPVDVESVIKLNPDLIFVKEGIISLEEANKITDLGVPVFVQRIDSVPDIISSMTEMGKILQSSATADSMVNLITGQLDSISRLPKRQDPPSVLLLISEEPLYVFGMDSYASSLLQLAGAENAVKEKFSSAFPHISREYLLKINPDLIITGGNDDACRKLLTLYPEMKDLNAVRNRACYTIDSDLLSRPGPRIVQSIVQIRKVLEDYEK